MTDKQAAIAALVAAIEAGESGWNRLATIAEDVLPPKEAAITATAYSGSLDAALAMQEALLPGWYWCVTPDGSSVYNPDDNSPYDCDGRQDVPARAWLLAILKAYQAQTAGSAP